MWPFKKKPKPIPFAEYVLTLPPAPCGEQRQHYEWRLNIGMACPVCSGIEKRRVQDERDQRMANMIAAAIIEQLKNQA